MNPGLYDPLSDALLDAFGVNGTTFNWKGASYDCILNADSQTLDTYKSEFANRSYPNRGDTIRVQGKNMQVTSIANATSAFVDGGIIDTTTAFTDDVTNPSLRIGFRPFITR